ncbi:transposase [Streptomyces sp. NPDC090077]|uniref:transposase n=1 Tax=Streptomyces sp. NPDC090077 TaxID=3365938 RepID=UPI0037FDF609
MSCVLGAHRATSRQPSARTRTPPPQRSDRLPGPRPCLRRAPPTATRILLAEWIRQAELDAPKPVSGFAGFLRQDLAAVTAGLTLHWSSGIVAGHVNRVRTLQRAMYGRASFTLLRTRILTQP